MHRIDNIPRDELDSIPRDETGVQRAAGDGSVWWVTDDAPGPLPSFDVDAFINQIGQRSRG